MFDFSEMRWPVPEDLSSLFARMFEQIASPGNAWNGTERVAIAQVARNGAAHVRDDVVPKHAIAAAHLVSSSPAGVNESWARETIDVLGETEYVELVGVVSILKAIDTATTMFGIGTEQLPEPREGDAVPAARNPRLKRRSAWVSTIGSAGPNSAISAAPKIQRAVTTLQKRLYIHDKAILVSNTDRGLSRTQMELVATKVSHSNECFF